MVENLRHILDTTVCTRTWLESLFHRVDELRATDYPPVLQKKIVATCFFEPSTRTRLSFTAATYKLGGNVLGFDSGSGTSVSKGESLEDTIRMVSGYADAIILRHPEAGAMQRAVAASTVPIINAGEGVGEHPTQAMIDLYTIVQQFGRLDNLHIAFVGNLKYYRTARSLVRVLAEVGKHLTMTFVSAPELRLRADVIEHAAAQGVTFTETTELNEALAQADVVYQTRMQKEWLTAEEFSRLKDQYILTRALVDTMKPGSIVLHPLPRVNEIESAVDYSEHAKYFEQAAFGLPVRAALLEYVFGLWQ